MAPSAHASTRLPSPVRRFLRSPTRFGPVLGIAAALFAWPAARPTAQDTPPVFRARTELVRLDVSVTDRAGRAVNDLRSDEIRITENGERRAVVLFRHVSEASEPGRDAGTHGFEEVSANDIAPSGHLYVLVFDQLHIDPGHEQRARLAAERFVTQQLKPGDAVAVYGLPGPGPQLNLTTDLMKARLALAGLHGQARRPIIGMREFDAYHLAGSGIAGDLASTVRPVDIIADMRGGASAASATGPFNDVLREQATQVVAQAETESQIFLAQLAGVMQKMQVVDGRKTFVLFSEGFFMNNVTGRLEQVASAAARSNSAIYSIDLGTSLPAPDQFASARTAADVAERRDPLATLALETNGRLIANPGDLDRVLAGIAAEASDYYLVAFEPAASDAPHGYHRVKVQTTRRGLVVHARTGYATGPEPTPFGDRQAIDVALTLPRISSALPIEYTTYERSGPAADRPRIIVSATAQVPCGRAADQAASIVFVVRDAVSGQAVASGTDRVPLPQSGDAGPGHLDAIHYTVQFDVPPGEYWMRMLVREPGGVVGTADRRFHVWPLDGAALSTSDLIVTRLDGPRFDPPPHAMVTRGDEVLAYLEVYGTAAAIQAADARVEIVRCDSEEVVATAEPVVKSGSRGERIVRARLPVANLPDGPYVARVRIATPYQAPRTLVRNFIVVSGDVKAHMDQ